MRKLPQFLTILVVTLQILSGVVVALYVDGTEEQQIYATNLYFFFNAVCWAFAFAIIALLTSGLYRQLMWVVVVLWVGKIIDEAWFDPTVISWNDIVNFVIAKNIALILIVRHYTKTR